MLSKKLKNLSCFARVLEKLSIDRKIYDYQLIELLEQNSFGARYKGLDNASNRQVSILVFASLIDKDPVLTDKLKQQADRLAVLRHPSILSVLSFEQGKQGCIWVEEYVEGQTLDRVLAQRGPLEWQQAVRYLKQLLSGLKEAHGYELQHESLHPGNIIITRGKVAKMSLFGLEHLVRKHSYKGISIYTPDRYRRYLPPEIQNESEVADQKADLFSIGLIGYEMLTKKSPSNPNSIPVVGMESAQTLAPPHSLHTRIPLSISNAIMQAVDNTPVYRFQTADQMVAALKSADDDIQQPNVVYLDRAEFKTQVRSLKSRRIIWFGLVILLFILGFFLLQANKKNPFETLSSESIAPLMEQVSE